MGAMHRLRRCNVHRWACSPFTWLTAQQTTPHLGLAPPADGDRAGLADTALLAGLFGTWYMANILFNIWNKQVLNVTALPITCTLLQTCVGAAMALLFHFTSLAELPRLDAKTIKAVAPLAAAHTLGNLLTNVSLGAMAVRGFSSTIGNVLEQLSVPNVLQHVTHAVPRGD